MYQGVFWIFITIFRCQLNSSNSTRGDVLNLHFVQWPGKSIGYARRECFITPQKMPNALLYRARLYHGRFLAPKRKTWNEKSNGIFLFCHNNDEIIYSVQFIIYPLLKNTISPDFHPYRYTTSVPDTVNPESSSRAHSIFIFYMYFICIEYILYIRGSKTDLGRFK